MKTKPIVVQTEKHYSEWMLIPMAILLVAGLFEHWDVRKQFESRDQETRNLRNVMSAGKLNYVREQKDWELLYQQYNNDYFAGTLPRATVRSQILDANISGETDGQGEHPVILINPLAILGEKHANEVLLHEMIHVKLNQRISDQVKRIPAGEGFIFMGSMDNHGREFRQELHRLIGLGAFDDLIS